MNSTARHRAIASLCLATLCLAGTLGSGCHKTALLDSVEESSLSDIPRELSMASIPVYRVAPPDILLIELVRSIRPANDGIRAGDYVIIRAANLEPYDPEDEEVQKALKTVNGEYLVQADGTIDLGPWYGSVRIEGQTASQAELTLASYLRTEHQGDDGRTYGGYQKPIVSVSLADVGARQIVAGEHLIRPDGTVSLGIYGSVYVAGMTLDEVKQAVEQHLGDSVHDAEVAVDVLAYNSKKIYLITDGGGVGEQVVTLPFTGGETVLDALANINGLSPVSSSRCGSPDRPRMERMWLRRCRLTGGPSPRTALQPQTTSSCPVTESTSRRIAGLPPTTLLRKSPSPSPESSASSSSGMVRFGHCSVVRHRVREVAAADSSSPQPLRSPNILTREREQCS